MINNYLLKQAVITALAALTLGFQNQALALGLGEIDVKSHIGQPLKASIEVQGISDLKDKACFRLGNDSSGINNIASANLQLTNIRGDNGTLLISTTEVVREPIVTLSVIAECNTNFHRDYVLLIDPLLTTDSELTVVEESVNTVEKSDVLADKSFEKLAVTEAQKIASVNSNGKKNRNKKAVIANKNNQSNNENIVLTVDYDKKQPNNNTVASSSANTKPATTPSKPRLSISGGEFFNGANTVGLRLDKQLRFSAETAPLALASNIAVEDEATVLANRLANLEQQITFLQQRNSTLETEKKLRLLTSDNASPANKSASALFKWWPYLVGAGLLIAAYFAADYWRRRRQSAQLDNPEDVWSELDANQINTTYYKGQKPELEDSLFDVNQAIEEVNLLNPKTAAAATLDSKDLDSNFIDEIAFQVEESNAESNILDHADVFLSHGRTSLAIQLLQNHLMDFPKQSVTVWLFLLDLLAKDDSRTTYDQTALECKEHFNIRIADFSNDEASLKQSLEDFPRLTAGLEQVWGTPAALVYLDDLIYNSRLETRLGFEKSVLEELLLLKYIAGVAINSAEVIQLDEKKMAIKELKQAKLAENKASKLQKLEELTLLETSKSDFTEAEGQLESFEFNLIDYK